jgi:glycosyltransferase involved in cell wall biosynthesis
MTPISSGSLDHIFIIPYDRDRFISIFLSLRARKGVAILIIIEIASSLMLLAMTECTKGNLKMPFLSIVIPSYKSEKTIVPLLNSIFEARNVKLTQIEIVIIDDKSPDNSVKTIESYIQKKANKLHNFKIIALKENRGPAHARNIGVRYAKGKVILFLDSDVVLYKDTLFELVSAFENDPDLFALTGVWSKQQKSRDFFRKFKALRDWSYWINERDPRNYYYLFSTRIAAIKRDLFLRLGGFDETYQAALVEDIELTYRIAKRHAVVFNPKVMVYHEFEGFKTVAKKYFWRSYYWGRIYRERKKFDPVATTSKEAITTISAGGLVFLSFVYLIFRIMNQESGIMGNIKVSHLSSFILYSLFLILIVHLWGVRKFLLFVAREEGILFALKSFVTGIALYLVILAGAVASYVLPPPVFK